MGDNGTAEQKDEVTLILIKKTQDIWLNEWNQGQVEVPRRIPVLACYKYGAAWNPIPKA